jgi:hypothetical protein
VIKAIWAVAHRLLHVIWRVLHLRERYRELGPLAMDPASIQRRFRRLSKQMAALGYTIQLVATVGAAGAL